MAKKRKNKIKTNDSDEIIQFRISKNKITKNLHAIEKICKGLKITNYKFIPYKEDMAISITHNMQDYLIICSRIDGYLYRLHKNEIRNSKGKCHYHIDGNEKKMRKFSTFYQALHSCTTTHNPVLKSGISWLEDLLNKNNDIKFK